MKKKLSHFIFKEANFQITFKHHKLTTSRQNVENDSCFKYDSNEPFYKQDLILSTNEYEPKSGEQKISLEPAETTQFWIQLYNNELYSDKRFFGSSCDEARRNFLFSLLKVGYSELSAVSCFLIFSTWIGQHSPAKMLCDVNKKSG